jgi:Fe-S-cluster containining protein
MLRAMRAERRDPDSLRNYRELLRRVDELCRVAGERLAGLLTCHEGCDACCRHLSLFAVEAAVLAEAVAALPAEQHGRLLQRARRATQDGPCPLLEEHACLIYEARPIICRTHGLPLLTRADGEERVDFCPRNCRGASSLPGEAVLDLDRLNAALAAVDALYRTEIGLSDQDGQRYAMRDVILDVLEQNPQLILPIH